MFAFRVVGIMDRKFHGISKNCTRLQEGDIVLPLIRLLLLRIPFKIHISFPNCNLTTKLSRVGGVAGAPGYACSWKVSFYFQRTMEYP